jgi:uncharacterized protein (TIGR00255 family)
MIQSMTAFAKADKRAEKLTVSVEIRSYNSRYLDVVPRIPPAYLSLEDRIKNLISEKLTRGRVEIRFQIKDESEDACAFEIDESRALAYYNALVRLRDKFQMENQISLRMLSGFGGVIKPAETERDMETYWPVIEACTAAALDALNAMRKKEGEFIARDFAERLDYIENCVEEIEKGSEGLLLHYQEKLKERITALTRGITEIDPARIAQEAAFLADRSDISEELTRAKSHLVQFRTTMNSEEPSGRKLNFLLQEFNREFNTIGSKTGNAQVSHMVVTVKSELEKIREQVQNVE